MCLYTRAATMSLPISPFFPYFSFTFIFPFYTQKPQLSPLESTNHTQKKTDHSLKKQMQNPRTKSNKLKLEL